MVFGFLTAWVAPAQERGTVADGIRKLSKDQWTIITDLPIDQEIESWPNLLDQALALWCRKWNLDPSVAKTWPLTIHCIGDRRLFERAGLLENLPAFDDGFQQADRVFLFEQPSVYYRRHLLLHEATHWVMYRAFGGGGSPWFMEGMAEVEGTHQIDKGLLELAIIPSDPQAVPHWGRFKRLSESVASKGLPSMKQILRYGNDRQDRMDRYSWSWAACVFFRNHPLYATRLAKSSAGPLDYSMKLSDQLLGDLGDRWAWVERDWKLFADEFDFGFQPQTDLIAMEQWTKDVPENSGGSLVMNLDPSKGWQLLRVYLKAEDRLTFQVDGSYVVRVANQQSWDCSPNGLTYQYLRHMPMGMVIGAFLSVETQHALDVFGIGEQGEFKAPTDGWVLFKVNEPVGQRRDNRGTLDLRVEHQRR